LGCFDTTEPSVFLVHVSAAAFGCAAPICATVRTLLSFAMREIRIFELDQADLPKRLLIGSPSKVSAMRERLWVTVEGQADDYWLAEGESLELPPHAVAWIGAEHDGGRLSITSCNALVHWSAPRAGTNVVVLRIARRVVVAVRSALRPSPRNAQRY
jgi:Protein of unknown function (DUF2917)